MSDGKVTIKVKAFALYVDGKSYPQGAEVSLPADEAKALLEGGEAEEVTKK